MKISARSCRKNIDIFKSALTLDKIGQYFLF